MHDPVRILVVSPDGRLLGANRAALDQLGMSGAELRARSLSSLLGTTPAAVVTLTPLSIVDQIPPGFQYKVKSATINGVPQEPKIAGRVLTWPNQTIVPGKPLVVRIMLVVGSGVGTGEFHNDAWVANIAGAVDVFQIWFITTLSIGLGVLYKKKTSGIATVLFILYAVIAIGFSYYFRKA